MGGEGRGGVKTASYFNEDRVLEGLVLAFCLTHASAPDDHLLAMARVLADADAEASVFALGHILRREAVPDELMERIKAGMGRGEAA